jgi:murein DD-endopeptidase MepM/ murein hydrolase activator NlpD
MARARNTYASPISKRDCTDISYRKYSRVHVGLLKHAVDFVCAEGTRVHAAAPGVVVWIRRNSRQGGSDPAIYWYTGNRIVIQHANNEYSAYEHLAYGSVVVSIGERVRRGQVIARTGNTGFTGYTYFPHVHFEVFHTLSADLSEGETLQVSFRREHTRP